MLQSKHWDIFVLFNFQCKFFNCTNQLKHGDKVGMQYVSFLVSPCTCTWHKMLVLLEDHALATCNRSSDCSCLHSRGCFSQIRGPAVSICSVMPPGIQLFLLPPPEHIGFLFSYLSTMFTNGHPGSRHHKATCISKLILSPSWYIAGSSIYLYASTATTPKSIFHSTATMIFLTIKSVYIFPLLKHSFVISRLSRKYKLLPLAWKVLRTQPVPPLYVPHLLSFIFSPVMLYHTALLLSLINTLLSLPAGLLHLLFTLCRMFCCFLLPISQLKGSGTSPDHPK